MQYIIDELKEKFEEIKKKGFIKGNNNSFAASGETFENLLGLLNHNFDIPDYKGIEIKCRRKNSKYPLGLFSTFPSNEESGLITQLAEKYGYPQNLSDRKIISGSIYANKLSIIGAYFLYKLRIDYQNERIYIQVLNDELTVLEENVFVTFELLKIKLYRKIEYLALVDTEDRVINGDRHYYYKNMNIYKLKGFKEFLKLLEKGEVLFKIHVKVRRSGVNKGKIIDNGISICINMDYLEDLYTKIS